MGTDNTPRKPDQLPPTPTQPKDSSNQARVAELNKPGTEVARAKTDGPTKPPNPEAHSLIGGLRDSAVPGIDQAKPAVKQVAGKDGHGVGQEGKKAEKLANAAGALIIAWSSIGDVVKNADNTLADRPSRARISRRPISLGPQSVNTRSQRPDRLHHKRRAQPVSPCTRGSTARASSTSARQSPR